MPTSCGRIYVTITKDGHGRPFEVFVRFGKAGHCGAAIFDGMTKLISYALRSGMEPSDAVNALSGIVCTYGRNTCLNAVAGAIGDVLAPPAAPAKAAKVNPHPHRSSPTTTRIRGL